MDINYCVLDFETGGFSAIEDAITEVAFVMLDKNLKELESFQSYVFPYGLNYSDEALKVTGITMERLTNEGLPIKEVSKRIRDILKAYKNIIFVAHNAKFDRPFVNQFKEHGKIDVANKFNPIPLCTMNLAQLLVPDAPRFRLSDLCEYFEIELENAHSALYDVRATAELLKALKSNGSGETEGKITTEEIKREFKL